MELTQEMIEAGYTTEEVSEKTYHSIKVFKDGVEVNNWSVKGESLPKKAYRWINEELNK